MDFLIFILVGAIAGYLTGRAMSGSGFGMLGNIIIGIIGGFVGGFLYSKVGQASSANVDKIIDKDLIFSIVYSAAGAMLVLYLAVAVKRLVKHEDEN